MVPPHRHNYRYH